MAEPFVFCFRPDAHGHPEQMYIADLLCACGVCGHEQIQRFYPSIPFHNLTLSRFERLLDEAHLRAEYACENCGSSVGPQEVATAVVRFAFADDCGEIVSYLNEFGRIDGPSVVHQLYPHRRLDPQVQPRFSPDEQLEQHLVLDEWLLAGSELDRRLSIKQSVRERVAYHWLGPERVQEGEPLRFFFEHLAPGYQLLLLDPARESLERLMRDDAYFPEVTAQHELHWIDLLESTPHALPTHEHPEQLTGAWRRWLPAALIEQLDAGESQCLVGVSAKQASAVIERAFEIARLDYEQERSPEGALSYVAIRSPTGDAYGKPLPLRAVLERAAYTGITAGEAARLTAEEIVGVMLRVWQRSG